MLVVTALITGLGLGSMYGLLALGFHVTYAVSATVNFAQGSSMMLGAVFAYVFAVRLGFPLFVSAFISLSLCAAYGVLVERLAVRPFASRGSRPGAAIPASRKRPFDLRKSTRKYSVQHSCAAPEERICTSGQPDRHLGLACQPPRAFKCTPALSA